MSFGEHFCAAPEIAFIGPLNPITSAAFETTAEKYRQQKATPLQSINTTNNKQTKWLEKEIAWR